MALGVLVMWVYIKNRKEKYANQVFHAGAGGIAGPAVDSLMWNAGRNMRRAPIVSYPPNDTCRRSQNIKL